MSHAPARAFAGRAPVGPAVTRRAVMGKRMARMTNRRLLEAFLTLVILLGIGALRAGPPDPQLLWLILGLPGAICLGFLWWREKVMNS